MQCEIICKSRSTREKSRNKFNKSKIIEQRLDEVVVSTSSSTLELINRIKSGTREGNYEASRLRVENTRKIVNIKQMKFVLRIYLFCRPEWFVLIVADRNN